MISVTYKLASTWTGNQIAPAFVAPSFEVLCCGRDMHEGGPPG